MVFMFIGFLAMFIFRALTMKQSTQTFLCTASLVLGILLGLFCPTMYGGTPEVLISTELLPLSEEEIYLTEDNGNYIYRVEDGNKTVLKTISSKDVSIRVINTLNEHCLNYCSQTAIPTPFSFSLLPIKKYYYEFRICNNNTDSTTDSAM